jgi:hypothetical protein
LKLAAEIKSALETEGMEKLVTDIKRHAITDENPNVPDEVIVQAVNNVLTRASAASEKAVEPQMVENGLKVRTKTVVQGFSEAMRASEVITIVGLPKEMFNVENASLKDRSLINMSKTLGKKGYGKLGDGHQIIAVPVNVGDAAATEKVFRDEIDKASSRGCMIVVFAPELDGMMVDVNGVKTGIAEALGARYKDTEAGDIIKIVRTDYTDSKPSEKQYPDILVRVLLALGISSGIIVEIRISWARYWTS